VGRGCVLFGGMNGFLSFEPTKRPERGASVGTNQRGSQASSGRATIKNWPCNQGWGRRFQGGREIGGGASRKFSTSKEEKTRKKKREIQRGGENGRNGKDYTAPEYRGGS